MKLIPAIQDFIEDNEFIKEKRVRTKQKKRKRHDK